MKNIITIAQTVWLEMLRRKDLYLILIIQGFFTFLLTTVNAFGSEVPSSYIMDIGLMLTFVLTIAIAITMGARQFPAEIRSGTIFSILTKPITRMEFLLGKWVGLWSGLVAANTLFYLIVTGVTLTKGFAFEPAVLIQVFSLHCALLGVVVAMSLFFTQFSSQGAGGTATGIFVVLCYLFVPRIPNMMVYETGWRAAVMKGVYFTAPHLELFDMRARVLHGWGLLEASILAATLAYGLLLTVVFLGLAWMIFQRKRFQRGANV